jgi:SAM-dependent methyltransferase
MQQEVRTRPEDRPRIPPLPPEALRRRVHGNGDSDAFRQVGERVCDMLWTNLGPRGALGAGSRVLDFGCGCGRVVARLAPFCGAELYGTDIDGEAIEWCRQNLAGLGRFERNGAEPPLPYPDGFFDAVYAISVFTHLPESMELAWLAEFARVTRPGGCLLLTTHGMQLLRRPDAATRARLSRARLAAWRLRGEWRYWRRLRGGFHHIGGDMAEGLPQFYGTSYHSAGYIRRQWTALVEVEAFLPRQVNGHQDLVLCRTQVAAMASPAGSR